MLFVACLNGHSCHLLGYAEFDYPRSGFIVPLQTGISAASSIVGQYDVMYSPGCSAVLSNLTLRH